MAQKEVKYKLLKELDLKNCHATVYVPERTPEEEAKQYERIKKATAEFMKKVIAARETQTTTKE